MNNKLIVEAYQSLAGKMIVASDDQVYIALNSEGHTQWYVLDKLTSNLVWMEGEQPDLDRQVAQYRGGF